jgi:hypothetical protein
MAGTAVVTGSVVIFVTPGRQAPGRPGADLLRRYTTQLGGLF